MSAGAFTNAKYAADYGAADQVHPIRVQPETLAAVVDGVTNATASGTVNNPISATISRGKRAKGLRPRTVTLRFTGTAPTGYATNGSTTIPALASAFYAKCVVGATGTYLGAAVVVVSASAETAK